MIKLDLTQETVAARMRTNKGQVNKLVNGGQRMNDRWIAGFASAFGIRQYRLLLPPDSPTADDLLAGASAEQVQAVRKTVSMMLQKPLSETPAKHVPERRGAILNAGRNGPKGEEYG